MTPQTESNEDSTASTATETEQVPVVEATPAAPTVVGGKKAKQVATGNLILDIAQQVEKMTKAQALSAADKLAETVEVSYLQLGGVLKRISENSWFEGFASFDEFVTERYGFKVRKARYLIEIYDNLVMKQIPWDKVAHLGWTKLKDLAPRLTLENVDEWVAKAEKLTVAELQALLAAPSGPADSTAPTSDGLVKMKFQLKPDQAETVSKAFAKAKGELKTDYDTVALEQICAGYLGGNTAVATPPLETLLKDADFEPLMHMISSLFPQWDIDIKPAAEVASA